MQTEVFKKLLGSIGVFKSVGDTKNGWGFKKTDWKDDWGHCHAFRWVFLKGVFSEGASMELIGERSNKETLTSMYSSHMD